MNILALDTSATPGAIALLSADEIVYETGLPDQRRTTESFASEIQAALRVAGWSPGDVAIFAICRGPGSFTGLRIGITAAKTYAYAIGCHVIALNTLDVLAAQVAEPCERIWAVLDAQRQQLFAASYAVSPATAETTRSVQRLTETQVVDASDFLRARSHHELVTGSGLTRWHAEATTPLAARSQWPVQPATLGRLAWQAYERGQRTDIWTLVPDYGRASAAEEKASGG